MSRKDWTDEELFFRLLNNKSEKAYWENMSVLRSRPNIYVFTRSKELIKSSDPKERVIGIDILAQLGLPPRPYVSETLELYFDILRTETDIETLESTLYGVCHNNESLDDMQVECLCSFQSHPHFGVRKALAVTLGGVNHNKAIDSLIYLSKDTSTQVRDWSTFGLGTLTQRNNKKIREALWSRVDDKHQETKLEAILGLALRKDGRVKDIIIRELIDGEYGVSLFEAIEALKDKDFLSYLKQNEDIAIRDNLDPEWIADIKKCIENLNRLLEKS